LIENWRKSTVLCLFVKHGNVFFIVFLVLYWGKYLFLQRKYWRENIGAKISLYFKQNE